MKYIFLLLFLLLGSQIHSQTSFGVKGGIVSSTWKTENYKSNHDFDYISNLTAGIAFEFRNYRKFSIQVEANYISKGFLDKFTFNGIKYSEVVKIDYFEIPFLPKYSLTTDKVRLDLLTGIAYCHKIVNTNYSELSTVDVFSYIIGSEISYDFGMSKRLFFDFRYQIGLTDLKRNYSLISSSGETVHDRLFQYCIGFLFPIYYNRENH